MCCFYGRSESSFVDAENKLFVSIAIYGLREFESNRIRINNQFDFIQRRSSFI